MSSRLINVRLDYEHRRKVQTLREHGVKLSNVVREAIDERFLELTPRARLDANTLIRKIFEQHPDPSGLPDRDYDMNDRSASRSAILRRLRRRG